MMTTKVNSSDTVVQNRRHLVAQMYMQGRTQYAISLELGVAPATVGRDLMAIREVWKSECAADYETRLLDELVKIGNLEMLAMEAWIRSVKDAEVHTKRVELARPYRKKPKKSGSRNGDANGSELDEILDGMEWEDDGVTPDPSTPVPNEEGLIPVKTIEETVRKGQAGDDKFLGRIAWCIEMRLKLMGALRPQEANVTVVNVNWDSILGGRNAPDPVEARIAAVRNGGLPPPVRVPVDFSPTDASPPAPLPPSPAEGSVTVQPLEETAPTEAYADPVTEKPTVDTPTSSRDMRGAVVDQAAEVAPPPYSPPKVIKAVPPSLPEAPPGVKGSEAKGCVTGPGVPKIATPPPRDLPEPDDTPSVDLGGKPSTRRPPRPKRRPTQS